jgi:hypothetical protein
MAIPYWSSVTAGENRNKFDYNATYETDFSLLAWVLVIPSQEPSWPALPRPCFALPNICNHINTIILRKA